MDEMTLQDIQEAILLAAWCTGSLVAVGRSILQLVGKAVAQREDRILIQALAGSARE